MGRSKSGFIVALVVFFIFAFMFLWLFTDRMAGTSQKIHKEDDVNAKLALADDYNFHIYWVGECPEELKSLGDKISVINPTDLSEDNMPIVWSDVHFVEYDELGGIRNELVPREYADHMLIVVREGANLTDEQLEVLRNCVVLNEVSMLIMGDSISSYRKAILLSEGTYRAHDTMLYSSVLGDMRNAIDSNSVDDTGKFSIAVLELMYNICQTQQEQWHDAVYGNDETTDSSVISEGTELE